MAATDKPSFVRMKGEDKSQEEFIKPSDMKKHIESDMKILTTR